tara:strand:- start:384 stop:872 length:489 start_codon:yes stop_codon:yes gene_type:complete
METFTGYIYKLTGSCGKVYIGSTVDKEGREKKHNSNTNHTNSKLLLKPLVFDVIDTREYRLIRTLRLVEQFYLDNINNINSIRAYTNTKKAKKKYYLENKIKIGKYHKLYRERNKEKMREKRENNKEKLREYQKLYVERNKEKLREYNREYQRLYRERKKDN